MLCEFPGCFLVPDGPFDGAAQKIGFELANFLDLSCVSAEI